MTYLALNATQPHRRGVSMQCTDIEGGDTHIEFDQSLHIMERSKFCLVLPGDSASTRRLSEIFMAGAPDCRWWHPACAQHCRMLAAKACACV